MRGIKRYKSMKVGLASIVLVTVAACGGGGSNASPSVDATSAPDAGTTVPDSVAQSDAMDALRGASPTVAPDAGEAAQRTIEPSTTETSSFPAGYPKIVDVVSLPDQVRNWYQMDNYTKAVAIAPGVWTPLQPGASIEDAAASGVLDGFCGSIKAYERQYTGGQEHGGSCW